MEDVVYRTLPEFYDSASGIYGGKSTVFFEIEHKVRLVVKEMVLRQNGRRRVLDVCCGNATFIETIAKREDLEITGLDFSEGMLEVAKERMAAIGANNVSFIHGIAQRLPFKDSMFDIVVFVNASSDVLNTDELKKVLKEIIRVSSLEGRIYLNIFNATNPSIFRDFRKYRQAPRIMKNYFSGTLECIAAELGLKIIRKIPVFKNRLIYKGRGIKKIYYQSIFNVYFWLCHLSMFAPSVLYEIKKTDRIK